MKLESTHTLQEDSRPPVEFRAQTLSVVQNDTILRFEFLASSHNASRPVEFIASTYNTSSAPLESVSSGAVSIRSDTFVSIEVLASQLVDLYRTPVTALPVIIRRILHESKGPFVRRIVFESAKVVSVGGFLEILSSMGISQKGESVLIIESGETIRTEVFVVS